MKAYEPEPVKPHFFKRGNNWYCSYNAHVGVDRTLQEAWSSMVFGLMFDGLI